MGQGRVVVAELDGTVVGTATMGPNRPGRGGHIATGSFMVAPTAAGRGVGRSLGEHVVARAREQDFRGIQFNAVVETDEPAVRLWRSLGFVVIGTVPGAFRHPERGLRRAAHHVPRPHRRPRLTSAVGRPRAGPPLAGFA